jgi:hypothetical protein
MERVKGIEPSSLEWPFKGCFERLIHLQMEFDFDSITCITAARYGLSSSQGPSDFLACGLFRRRPEGAT